VPKLLEAETMTRRCRCPGYFEVHHDHDQLSGDCNQLGFDPSGLCGHCDAARYAAIGRVAERLFTLLQGTNDE
jgi:hypothetical protein